MHVAYVMRKVVLVMFVGARLLAITRNDENLNSKFLAHFREKHCYTNRNNFTKDSGKIMYTCHGARWRHEKHCTEARIPLTEAQTTTFRHCEKAPQVIVAVHSCLLAILRSYLPTNA
jgi:hypothetical protein